MELMKLKKILDNLMVNPTFYDVGSYLKPWAPEEINQLMLAEYSEIEAFASTFGRSEEVVIAKYLEIVGILNEKIVMDVKVLNPAEATGNIVDRPLTDFIQGVSIVNCAVGEAVRVNIRIVDQDLITVLQNGTQDLISHHINPPATNSSAGELYGGVRTTKIPNTTFDPNRYGIMKYTPFQAGSCQIGFMVKENPGDVGIKKTILVNVS